MYNTYTTTTPLQDWQNLTNLSDSTLEEVHQLCHAVSYLGTSGRLADIKILTQIYRESGSLFISTVKYVTLSVLVALALVGRIVIGTAWVTLLLGGTWIIFTQISAILALYVPNYSMALTVGLVASIAISFSWYKGRVVGLIFWFIVQAIETVLIIISGLLLWAGFISIVYLLAEQAFAYSPISEQGNNLFLLAKGVLGTVFLLIFWWSSRIRLESTNRWLYWLYFPHPAIPEIGQGSQLYRLGSLLMGTLRAFLYLVIFGLILIMLWGGVVLFFDVNQGALVLALIVVLIWRTATVGHLYEKPVPWLDLFRNTAVHLRKHALCKYTCYIGFRRCQWYHYANILRWQPKKAVCQRCLRRFTPQKTGRWMVRAWGCPDCLSDIHCQARVSAIDICLDRRIQHDRLYENGRLVVRALGFPSNASFPDGPALGVNSWFFEYDQITVGHVYWGDIESFLLGCYEKGEMPWSNFAGTPCYLQTDHTASPADLVRLGAFYYLGCQIHYL